MRFQYKVVLTALAQVSQSQFIDSEIELTDKDLEAIAKSQQANNIWDYEGVDEMSIEIDSTTELWLRND